jgi:hypothetical protein
MKMNEVAPPKINIRKTVNDFRNFFAICVDELKLPSLPQIEWIVDGSHHKQHNSFGSFRTPDPTIHVEITDRHPIDVMRTLAHELVHYKQWLDGRIEPDSGDTGSNIENEANAVAGVIMRRFDNEYPEAFNTKALTESTKPKVTKLSVKYQDKPKNDNSCLFCTMWKAPNACTAVQGSIVPTGWCKMFASKQSSKKILTKAVTDLENTLLATNSRKHTYDEIDKIMTNISSDNKITSKQLHNAFKKKHGVSPDEWIEYQEIG